jgi:hypothetical protein
VERGGVQGARRGRRPPAIEERLAFPLVVKPAGRARRWASSSPATRRRCPGALVAAFSYDHKVLLERFVAGRDLAVSVLDGQALPVVEAVPVGGGEYDFEARYEIGRTAFVCPAEIGDDATARAQELAVAAYRLLGCEGFARVDLMCSSESDDLQLLEVNPVPGLTETSLLPQAADAAGIPFEAFVERVLELALERRRGAGLALRSVAPRKSSGVTRSRKSLNLSTTSSWSSTSCSNSIADSAMTSSAAKIGRPSGPRGPARRTGASRSRARCRRS